MFVVVLALGTAAIFGLSGGTVVSGTLSEQWVSDTARDIEGNHHAPAVGNVNGSPTVYAPISASAGTDGCGLVALHGENGTQRWEYQVPPDNCTIHSVADPTLADFDDDGTTEVLAATTEQAVAAYHPVTGEEEFRHDLSSYGYTKPVVADLTGDDTPEVVVVDVRGTVFALESNGTERWTDRLDSYTWAQPSIADFTGDGENEVVVGVRSGTLRLYGADGTVRWNVTNTFDGAITWITTADVKDRSGTDVVVGTTEGTVALVTGTDGRVVWEHDFGEYAAVHAVGDGDSDGTKEVYAVARDGDLRSVRATDGTVEWTTTLTTADVQMTPPPSIGDLDDDEEPELVAVTNDGVVSVIDPDSGEVLDSYERDVTIFTHPTLADADGDGVPEPYVIYGDGRVVAFSFSEK
jgi:outer membrane protein assembly factor BamB